MSGALMAKVASSPQVRQAARAAGIFAVRQLGRSRQNRANRGRWYAGKRIGIPARMQRGQPMVSAPSALGQQVKSNAAGPSRTVTGAEMTTTVTVTHAPIDGVFTDSYPINPAEEYTFPRLSTEAALFQQYRFKSVKFSYVPSVSSTQVGTLGIGFQADPTQALPTTMEQMMSLYGAQTGNLWQPMQIPVPVEAMSHTLYKFYSQQGKTPAPTDDNRLQSCGRLVIMIEGVAMSSAILGHIRTQYTIEFSDPRPTAKGTTTAQLMTWAAPALGPMLAGNADADLGVSTLFDNPDGLTMRKRTHHPAILILKNGPGGTVDIEVDGVAQTPVFTTTSATHRLSVFVLRPGRPAVGIIASAGPPTDCAVYTHSTNGDIDFNLLT